MIENQKQSFSYKKALYALIISFVVILAILAFFGGDTDFTLIFKMSPLWIVGVILIYMLAQSINALRTKLLLKSYGIKLPYREAFVDILLMQFFNNLTPFAAGGQPYQIYEVFLPKYWKTFLKIPGIGIFAFLGAFLTIALLIFLVTLSYSKKMLMKFLDALLKPKFLKKIIAKFMDCKTEEVRDHLVEKFEEFNYYMKLIWKKGPHYMLMDIVLSISFSLTFKFIMYFILIGLLGASGTSLFGRLLHSYPRCEWSIGTGLILYAGWHASKRNYKSGSSTLEAADIPFHDSAGNVGISGIWQDKEI